MWNSCLGLRFASVLFFDFFSQRHCKRKNPAVAGFFLKESVRLVFAVGIGGGLFGLHLVAALGHVAASLCALHLAVLATIHLVRLGFLAVGNAAGAFVLLRGGSLFGIFLRGGGGEGKGQCEYGHEAEKLFHGRSSMG